MVIVWHQGPDHGITLSLVRRSLVTDHFHCSHSSDGQWSLRALVLTPLQWSPIVDTDDTHSHSTSPTIWSWLTADTTDVQISPVLTSHWPVSAPVLQCCHHCYGSVSQISWSMTAGVTGPGESHLWPTLTCSTLADTFSPPSPPSPPLHCVTCNGKDDIMENGNSFTSEIFMTSSLHISTLYCPT